jgi:PAS domain S-box-containing protein
MSEQKSEEFYKELVESVSDIIAMVDNRGVLAFVNSRVEYYHGMTVKGLIGQHFSDLVHPDDLAQCAVAISQALSGVPSPEFHFRLKLPDGCYRHLVANGSLRHIGGEEMLLAVCRDATDFFEVNEKLIARNNTLSALTEIAMAMSTPSALDDGLRVALDRILSAIALRTGAIVIKDSQGRLRIRSSDRASRAELSEEAAAAARLISDTCIESGELVAIPSTRDETVDPRMSALSDELGVEAAVSMPLRCGSTVRAALTLGLPVIGGLNAEQMEFLNLAAGILGPAIENASLHSDLSDRVNRLAMLERLAKSINTGRDVHTVLNVCMREIADLISYDLGVVILLSDSGEAEVFPFSKNGVPLPVSRIELGAEQMKMVGSLDGPAVFSHHGPGPPFHTRPDTFQPTGGSGAVAPLVRLGRMFGLLKVWSNESERFGERETGILESAAEHLSIAAHNAGLYEAEQRKSLELAVLGKEAQHRIKNNLQMITGLLNMSLKGRDTGRRAVERCLRQVDAVLAVHQLLNQDSLSEKIRLEECLSRIAASAIQATGRGETVKLVMSGDGCLVNADCATAVGVIVNEFVNNAIEHGFGEAEAGRVEIRVGQTEKTCVIEVIDDGIGLPADFEIGDLANSSTGLGLASSLATYGLGGKLEIERAERGTCARISVKGA